MSRSPVHTRSVDLDDATALMDLWSGVETRFSSGPDDMADVLASIRKVLASDRERIVVAEIGGRVVGAIHLRLGPLAPLGSELAVHLSHLSVLSDHRRKGVGRSLVETGVAWAEDSGITHVTTLTAGNARETNRFLARLGLAHAAVVRVAPTHVLRARLPMEYPAIPRQANNRQLSQVLAARRSMRKRSQTSV